MQSIDLFDYAIFSLLVVLGIIALAFIIYVVYKEWKGEDPFDGIF